MYGDSEIILPAAVPALWCSVYLVGAEARIHPQHPKPVPLPAKVNADAHGDTLHAPPPYLVIEFASVVGLLAGVAPSEGA